MYKAYSILSKTSPMLSFIVAIIIILEYRGKVSVLENPYFFAIDSLILGLFTLEYILGLIISKNKLEYIKKNIINLLSLIPVYQFRVFRGFRLLRLVKLISLAGRSKNLLYNFLEEHKIIYISIFLFGIISFSSIIIYYVERGYSINSFEDAIWWTIVTITTVGYGDIAPHTSVGKFLAIILMLSSIGIIGAFTGAIASFIFHSRIKGKSQNNINLSYYLKDLSEEEIKELKNYIDFIKYKRNKS